MGDMGEAIGYSMGDDGMTERLQASFASAEIFTPMAGGLGDILAYYLNSDLAHYRAIKELGARTKVKIWSNSDQVGKLFLHNKNVDVVDVRPFQQHVGKFYAWAALSEPNFRLMTTGERCCVPWEQTEFCLTADEQEMAAEIESKGPYVVVHPFAGLANRVINASEFVTEAAKHARVVVLGGDSKRGYSQLFESYRAPFHPNVTNLVNLFSVRLHAHIARKASKFIGTVSCYNSVAQHFKIPSLIFASPGNRVQMQNPVGVFEKMRTNKAEIHYTDWQLSYHTPSVIRDFLRR